MGPDFITYRDIQTYTISDTDVAPINTPVIPLGPKFITPTTQLYILEVDVTVFGQEIVSGEFTVDASYYGQLSFPSPSSPALEASGTYAVVDVVCKMGDQNRIPIMRSIPAGSAFALIPGSAVIACGLTPPVAWYGIVTISMFYVLIN